MIIAKKCFLTKGVGRHKEKLTSFEMALRSAGIAAFNLVRVTSIFPPRCKVVSRTEGLNYLKPGEVVFCVLSDNATNEPHRLVAASVGIAIPKDKNLYGYLSEHHSYGQTDAIAGDYSEDLAAEMLATTMGLEYDPAKSWDENREIYKISNKVVRTVSITQSAVGDKKGYWTSVVTGCIFITDV
ncbi:MAG: arginine decarboxylase, pyruvoyl-dependent [Acidobacteria bacterium]|nr:arginine decarboxylase, pyruvoyl-dependent [Acidobacteriota bacterium]MBI3656748.1 arginine decarboxylase, pyruvoyl-dependent [Acidobacteriota bacterium]